MDIQDVLRILKNGAEKTKDDLNDYTKGKRDGQVQAYSHAWTLVKNLSLSGVVVPKGTLSNNCKVCGRTIEEMGEMTGMCVVGVCPNY
jgi:hypothetical protein